MHKFETTVQGPQVDIVVLTYNSDDDIQKFWVNIVKDLPRGWTVHFRDHGGTKRGYRSLTAIQDRYAITISEGANRGFAHGINALLQACTAPYVAIINPDVEFKIDTVAELVATLERFSGVSAVGPRLTDQDGKSVSDARRFPMPTDMALRRPTTISSDGSALQTVDWLSGAFMVWRLDDLRAIDGFDTGYFLFWEDVDICRRTKANSVHVRNDLRAVHRVGGSHQGSRASRRTNAASRRRYARKWHGRTGHMCAVFAQAYESLANLRRRLR